MTEKIDGPLSDELSDWLKPIDEASRCGEDLEYENEFLALLEGIKPPAIDYDPAAKEQLVPEDDRNWRELRKEAEKLSKKTRSLDLAIVYTQILVRTTSSPIQGLKKGLFIIEHYIAEFWECVYPVLDSEDDDPHFFRYNTLSNLGDWKSVVLPLKKDVVVLSIDLGDYTLDDVINLDLGNNVEGKQPLSGLTDDELSSVTELKASYKDCADRVRSIKKLLQAKTGQAFSGFDKHLLPYLQMGYEIQPFVLESVNDSPTQSIQQTEGIVSQTNLSPKVIMENKELSIQSRDDVEKAFELICDYYAQHEPSSPVPLLLQRARKLVKQDFRSILDELRLGGMSDIENIFGRLEE